MELSVGRSTIQAFADLTGDHSRIHLDRDYALSLGFHDNFAHGLLGASWAAGVLAQAREAEGQWPSAMEVNYGAPVFCRDSLSLAVEDEPGATCFTVANQSGQSTCHGRIQFAAIDSLEGRGRPGKLAITRFVPQQNKVYYARDVLEDGPRGESPPFAFTEAEVMAYRKFTAQDIDTDKLALVPPMQVFCRAFTEWLQAFTAVPMPDAGFPGHLQDKWQQLESVQVGDVLTTRHRPVAMRSSRSKPGMAILEMALETSKQQGEIVQQGSVLLLMAEEEQLK